MKKIILTLMLLSCVYPIVRAEDGGDNDVVATLYDFAFFAQDGNIVISQIDKTRDRDGEYWLPDKWGLIDTTGKVIVDGKTTWLVPTSDELGYMEFPNPAGYIRFQKAGSKLYGIFDKDYKVQISPVYKYLELYGEYAVGKKDAAKRVRDIIHVPSKKVVGHVKDNYYIHDISEDMVWATDMDGDTDSIGGRKSCMLDLKGNVVISSDMIDGCDFIAGFKDGMAAIENGEWKLGFIDKKGNMVIAPEYDYDDEFFILWDQEFHNGRAILRKDEKDGVIDKNGNVVIPFDNRKVVWDDESGYRNFIVTKSYYDDESCFLFDINGKKIGKYTPPVSNGWFVFHDEATGKNGIKDSEGNVILPAILESYSSSFSDRGALVAIENEGICLIDSKGRIVRRRLAKRGHYHLPG